MNSGRRKNSTLPPLLRRTGPLREGEVWEEGAGREAGGGRQPETGAAAPRRAARRSKSKQCRRGLT
jgi:hypothetical protein